MLLFEDDEIYVAAHDVAQSDHDFLLITFAHIAMPTEGHGFWGQPVAEKLGIDSIGFVSRKPNWYPETSMRAAIAALAPRLARHTRRLTYGSSQGGYGALKYASALQAAATLAFVPQYSIDPSVVGEFTRNSHRFRPDFNQGMEITAADVAPRSYIFIDPQDKIDRWNVEMIRAAAPGVTVIWMPHTQHRPVMTIARAEIASLLFSAALAGDAPALGRLTAQARRASAHRSYHLFRAASVRHPVWAAGIFRREAARMVADELLRARPLYHKVLRRLTARASREGDVARAIALAESAIEAATDDASRGAALSDLASVTLRKRRGSGDAADLAAAMAAARAALLLLPAHRPTLRVLATALGIAGAFAEAAATMRQVLALNPADPSGHHALAGYLMRCRDRAGAIAAAQEAVARMPDNAGFQKRLATAEAMRP
ncbi:hypothetical protein ACQW02_20625 [Humitalea sp. 24SJ18S-53]|uniref:hypothetical protein n=1 Tax=Humitalea sp. 24SJ18S-53 TaxID=3422307 RepID=UPI003D67529C